MLENSYFVQIIKAYSFSFQERPTWPANEFLAFPLSHKDQGMFFFCFLFIYLATIQNLPGICKLKTRDILSFFLFAGKREVLLV